MQDIEHSTDIQRDMMLEVAADPCLLCAVRGMVRSYLVDAGFDGDKISEIVLGVDEACTNVIRHAYCGDRDRRYRILLCKSASWLEVQVQDDGDCANAEMYEDTGDGVTDLDAITPGGLGVRLIHTVFDEVEYLPETDEGNCVIMRLKRQDIPGDE
ncbi:MAG: hypothetical protein COA73_13420 [Candidatus Hydrogenedentota bacterium]|nr:MAG: hypothetical protein COA73_13420 [Candidatus Hydrogenedentota bacterium]